MATLRDTALPLAIAAAITAVARALGRPARPCDAAAAVGVFVAAGAWDVVLREFSEGNIALFGIEGWGWVTDLRPYFVAHGILGAASIAGAVGVLALAIIRLAEPRGALAYSAWVFAVSALVGIPMRVGGWFTELQANYYERHPYLTYATDGMSGLVVAATVLGAAKVCRLYSAHC